MEVYLNESGDLGFTFDKPFRKGGSSRYLTISFLFIPKKLSHLPKRIVRRIYDKRKQPPCVELKGPHLSLSEKKYLAGQTVKLLAGNPEVSVLSVTINKRTVKGPARRDCARLFDYVNRRVLSDKIKGESIVTLIPDERAIKAGKGNLFTDYLQAELWFGFNADTVIENSPRQSRSALNLQFIDWVGHIIWEKYEDNETEAYDILKRKIDLVPWWETLSGQW